MFKTIQHIDDVWPFVKDIPGITLNVKEDEGFQVINYQFVTQDTFNVPEALECRGIKFDLGGNIIARPLHKFFNLYEKQGINDLDWDSVAEVQQKYDGSMVHGIVLDGDGPVHRLMTRAGLSDQALEAEKFMFKSENEDLFEEMLDFLAMECTPIYEYMAPSNRIVIKYDKPSIKLLAVRDNITGRYLDIKTGNKGMSETPQELVDRVRGLKDDEGVVVVWPDGHRIKIKADEYVTLHRAKEMLDREINLIRCIFDGTDDDLVAMTSDEDRQRLEYYIRRFNEWLGHIASNAKLSIFTLENMSQKDFALWVQTHIPKALQGLYFQMRKEVSKDKDVLTRQYFSRLLPKQDKVELVATQLPNMPRWNY